MGKSPLWSVIKQSLLHFNLSFFHFIRCINPLTLNFIFSIILNNNLLCNISINYILLIFIYYICQKMNLTALQNCRILVLWKLFKTTWLKNQEKFSKYVHGIISNAVGGKPNPKFPTALFFSNDIEFCVNIYLHPWARWKHDKIFWICSWDYNSKMASGGRPFFFALNRGLPGFSFLSE